MLDDLWDESLKHQSTLKEKPKIRENSLPNA